MRKTFFIIFVFVFAWSLSIAQKQKQDSLINLIKSGKTDSIRVKAFSTLCYMFRNSNQDTAVYFGTMGLALAQKINWEKGISSCLKNLGIVRFETGQYETSIDYFMKSLKIDEKNNDLRGMASNYNYIGSVYHEQNRFDKAEEYYRNSLQLREKLNDKKGIAASYNNIGLIYYNLKDYQKALEYYTKSLKMKENSGDKYNLAGGYNNVGMAYAEMGHTKSAIEFYQKSLGLRVEIGDQKGIAAVLGNISILNNTLADSAKTGAEKMKYFSEAVNYGLKCLKISEKINALLWKNKTAEALQKAYKGLGNYQKSLEYAEQFISTNDSLFREDKVKAIEEIDVRYQTEKKEQLIELQKTQIEKKEIEARQHKTYIYSILIVLFLVLLLFFIAMVAYRQKIKANILLTRQKHEIEEKNEELNQQKEEIITQRDEIENQRNQILERNAELNQKNEEIAAQRDFVIRQGDILSQQNLVLEEQKKEITDSILYALRIQQVLLPKDETLAAAFREYFILYKPRDIVSGDFYWFREHNNWLIFCVADCTGHGVPGAFMSMLGISFLNDIIRNKELFQASFILEELRKHIVDSLHQGGGILNMEPAWATVRDGMDIALCMINKQTLEMQFAGANNPCYIIQFGNDKSNLEAGVGQFPNLFEIKGDKMSVGYHETVSPFTNTTRQLYTGDIIYLFSDGFANQFGGEKETKYKISAFKELLFSNASLPLCKQGEILNTTIEHWKNRNTKNQIKTLDQTDDITVMGIRV